MRGARFTVGGAITEQVVPGDISKQAEQGEQANKLHSSMVSSLVPDSRFLS